jgi:hypothetical protein
MWPTGLRARHLADDRCLERRMSGTGPRRMSLKMDLYSGHGSSVTGCGLRRHGQARADGLSEQVLGPLAQRLIAYAGERVASITATRSNGPVPEARPG